MEPYRRTNARVLALLGSFFSLALASGSAKAADFFVDDDAPGGDGTMWSEAFNDLQDALAQAGVGDIVHVAQGTYKPTTGTNRSISFIPANGVILRGSYIGFDDPNPDQRNIFLYETILSGDIGIQGDNLDNSYHVIKGDTMGIFETVFNGFIIRDGRATGAPPNDNKGGGVWTRTPMAFVNSTFESNAAGAAGGAIWTRDAAHLTVRNCIFQFNSTFGLGGAIFGNGQFTALSVNVVNALFIDNNAGNFGGAIMVLNVTDLDLVNCTFSKNETGGSGSAVYATLLTDVDIANCIVWGNGNGGNNQIAGQGGVDILISYTLIQHSIPNWDGGHNIIGPGPENDPQFSDPDADNYRLLALSPAIDAGNQNITPADTFDVDDDDNTSEKTPDLDLRDRVIDGNEDMTDEVDMGPYEFDLCPWDIAPVGGDCVVSALDLIELLITWGPCDDCDDCPADFDDNCTVGASDLLTLLVNWGRCACGALEPLSLEEELADACLSQADWDEFEAVMTDPESSQEDKDNYLCWMEHYLYDCNKCFCIGLSGCPGPDPFD